MIDTKAPMPCGMGTVLVPGAGDAHKVLNARSPMRGSAMRSLPAAGATIQRDETQRLSGIETTLRWIATVIGWSAVAAIAFVTLAPIESRPHFPGSDPDIERFLAFLLLSGALSLAYPRRFALVIVLAIGFVIGLEAAQFFEPTRHGRPHDAIVKVLGVMAGGALAFLTDKIVRARRRAY